MVREFRSEVNVGCAGVRIDQWWQVDEDTKLVVHPVDFNGGDGGSFDGTEEDPAERIADGVAITRFKRLGNEFGIILRVVFFLNGKTPGQFKFS